MDLRVRVAATFAVATGALGALAVAGSALVSTGSTPRVVGSFLSTESCKDAPPVPQRLRPSAVAVFDPVSGAVLHTAVVGDALVAVLAGNVVVTEAGDGWLRGFNVSPSTELVWCLHLQLAAGTAVPVAGIVAIADTVVAVAGGDVIGVDVATGARRWSTAIGSEITSLSAGQTHVFVWTASAGASAASPPGIVALSVADGARAWPQAISPCPAEPMAVGSQSGPPPFGCAIPVGPGKVIQFGPVAVFEAGSAGKVLAIDVVTGRPRWGLDGWYATDIAASPGVLVIHRQNDGDLVRIGVDGERLYSVPAAGFGLTVTGGAILMLDQRLGLLDADGRRGGPPKNTALVARSPNDGSALWTTEVPGIPQRIGTTDGLAFTSSGKEVAAVNIVDGAVSWRTSISTPAKSGRFSVAGSWELLGQVEEGLVAIAAAERPHRD